MTGADGVRDPVALNLIRDVRPDLHPDLVHPLEGTPTDGADSHEVIVATVNADFIHARGGDDTVYGEAGMTSSTGMAASIASTAATAMT